MPRAHRENPGKGPPGQTPKSQRGRKKKKNCFFQYRGVGVPDPDLRGNGREKEDRVLELIKASLKTVP